MFKETVEYVDYMGNQKKEDLYFHLNQAEIVELELGTKGGYTEWVKGLVEADDTPTMFKIFKDIIIKSYGERTVYGGFAKTKEVVEKFISSEAYSIILTRLVSDEEFASKFMNGVIAEPKKSAIPAPPVKQ